MESYDSSFVKTIDVHRKPAPEVSAEDMEMEYGEMNARPFKVVANKPLLEFCWYEMDDGKKKTPFVLGEDFVANPEFSAQYMLVARDESNCLDTAFVNFERTFRPPRAQDDLLEIHADETGEVNLIANDFCPYSGKEGDSVVILSHPSVGEAKFNTQTKRLEYHAPEGFSGTAELRYKLVSRLSGMESEARVVIEISDGTGIKIPEVFTPNADGLQDRFVIKKIEEFPNNHLIVYNRWGFKVYEARGYANEWDGTSQADSFIGSKVLPADTYYYVLDIGTAVYKGFVYIYY